MIIPNGDQWGAALLAFEREGDWNHPKIAAWGDLVFGPVSP
jgi:hypothetical protein